MSKTPIRKPVVIAAFYVIATALGSYFAFAAIQGDFGLFRRMDIAAETAERSAYSAELSARVARLENLTRRLSDDHLDLDLLDERARAVLGQVRLDEIVIR